MTSKKPKLVKKFKNFIIISLSLRNLHYGIVFQLFADVIKAT